VQINSQDMIPWADETITITSVRVSGNVSVTLNNAATYRSGKGELRASGGVYQSNDVKFKFAQTDVPFEPKPGDQITWKGNTYTLFGPLAVGGSDFLNFWSCMGRNLVLANDLYDTCDVLRPDATTDAGGKRTPNFSTVYTGVPCRLQEEENTVGADDQGGLTARRRFTAYVGQRLYLRAGDVLRVTQAGTTTPLLYDFSGSASFDRIDYLGEVTVYRTAGQG